MEETKRYALCRCCDQTMSPKVECLLSYIIIRGRKYRKYRKYERVKAGDSSNIPNAGENYLCHDCNVGEGQYHHMGCVMELCPLCNGQLHICNCYYFVPIRKDVRSFVAWANIWWR